MDTLGNVFILGDSYSTYKGYNPEGYAVYYGEEDDSLSSASQTWWGILIGETGSELVMNDSFSGSAVCHTGYGGYEPENSFVERLKKHLVDGRCGTKTVDTVIVFGGTNDSWASSPVGSPKYKDRTEDDLSACLPAFCEIIEYIKNSCPCARIIAVINHCIKDEIKSGMEEICTYYNVSFVRTGEIELSNGHPTSLGMRQTASRIEEIL